eukprot:GFUD01024162.1.p1 GENE.GFUD01024162.1~~GFUD01024162.1.p1  ORF type:complete len:552 (+),score=197.24 GFUD01024162.1:89-1744(+)
MSLTADLDKEGSMKSVRPRLTTVKRGRGARIGGDYLAKDKDEIVTRRMPHFIEGEKYRGDHVATNSFVTGKSETVAIDEGPKGFGFYNPDDVSTHKSVPSSDQIRPMLRRTSPAKPAPLRPPLQPTQLLNNPIGQNSLHTDWSDRSEKYNTSSGTRDQVLPHQTQQRPDNQQLSLLEREKQIALVEKELSLARRMMELERREQEVKEMVEEQRKGYWHVDVPSFVENENRVELESNEVSRIKVRELLERKRRDLNYKKGISNSMGVTVRDATEIGVGDDKAQWQVFNSDEENDSFELPSNKYCNDPASDRRFKPHFNTTVVEASAVGEEIPDQEELWNSIKREKEEEEERFNRLRQSEVAREQVLIFNKIKEEIECRRKEEEMTMQFIAKLSLNDQRQQQNVTESVSAPAASTEPELDGDWTMERIGGVQAAHQQRRWDGNVPFGWYGNEMQPVFGKSEAFKDVLVHGNSRGVESNYVKKEMGARQRSKKYEEEKKRKAAVELKLRIADQERRARIEKEILGREWEMANMRKENGSEQTRSDQPKKTKKQK